MPHNYTSSPSCAFKPLGSRMVGVNGTANGSAATGLKTIFPDALTPLKVADPEVNGIIEDEKARQW